MECSDKILLTNVINVDKIISGIDSAAKTAALFENNELAEMPLQIKRGQDLEKYHCS